MAFDDAALVTLRDFLREASRVIPYEDVACEASVAGSIAMRHDVDHSIDKAVHFAEWENAHSFKSTYFILHSAPYWDHSDHFKRQVALIDELGHEVGLHNDALCAMEGDMIAAAELLVMRKVELEDIVGHAIGGIADHGGAPHTNGDIWDNYEPDDLGFDYEAYQLQKSTNTYISDNQGRWRSPLRMAQTFMLVHPTWWPV